MKAKLSLFLIVFMFCAVCQAQTIAYGVTANLNLTQTDAKGLSSSLHSGYNGGVYSRITLSKKWSLQPEILYTYQSLKKATDFGTYYVSSGRSISYTNINLYAVSVPVLANYRVSGLITIQAGPEYDRLLYSDDNLLKDNKSAFKKDAAGIVGGIKITFSPALSLFGNYYYNLTNINNIDNRYTWRYSQMRIGINVRVF